MVVAENIVIPDITMVHIAIPVEVHSQPVALIGSITHPETLYLVTFAENM